MIATHLPVLQVVVPLISAPVCVVLRHGRAAWLLALSVSWIAFGVALALLARVLDSGPISYAVGNWQPPWGIEYRIDLLNGFVLVVVSGIAAVVLPYARASVEREIPADRIYLFYSALLLCLTGLLGIAVTGDIFNLFVFLEIASLSSYVLVSFGADRRALTAAYRYLIMGTIGATFYVIGIGLLYQMTGSLNMADLAAILPGVADSRTVRAAFAFLAVGISLKLALLPLHFWLPNAYAYAPSTVAVFLAATSTKVAVYVLIRILFTVFGGSGLIESTPIREIALALALLAMVAASLVALFQTDVKRLLAYSSLAQIGYMIFGIGLLTVPGLAGGIVHIFNHALTKGLLFMAVGAVMYRTGSVRLEDMAGIGRRMPLTMAAFVVGGLSLIGVPATVGFVSKWALVAAALDKGWWFFAAIILISSLIALAYVWRVIEVAYFRAPPPGAAAVREAPLSMLLPMAVLAAATVGFGIAGVPTLAVATRAAESLLAALP